MDNDRINELLKSAGKEKRPELIEKLKAAKTQDERMALVREYTAGNEPERFSESYELSEEELDMVAGGAPWDDGCWEENCCY